MAKLPLRDQLALDRTVLAVDRTWLAIVRTSIAVAAAGVSIVHLVNEPWARPVGSIVALMAIPVVLRGWRVTRRMRADLQRISELQEDLDPGETPGPQGR